MASACARVRRVAPAVAAALLSLVGVARAAPSVELHATFKPERLGRQTSVRFDVRIQMPDGRVPPPLVEGAVRYPAGVDIGLSGLGLDTCEAKAIEAVGPRACHAESIMGEGTAEGEVQVGPEVVREGAHVIIFRAPERAGKLAMLFYVDAEQPVIAQLVVPALLGSAPPGFGGQLQMQVPLVPTWPEGPDVAVTRVKLAFGPRGLTYYERVRHRLVAYHPRGILLPARCPHRGFTFSGTFTFLDGERTLASTSVPCPGRSR
jgi:hypothetical protein